MRRREFIGLGVGGVAAASLGAVFWDDVFSSAASRPLRRGLRYGRLRAPDEHGFRLPEGFRSRIVARGKQPVPGTAYVWHIWSDGMATFPVDDGGHVLVSNSETLDGGASAIRFGPDAEVSDAYRILSGTTQNCSGGGTPWGTWLSCEEVGQGLVWECDPSGRRPAVPRPALGTFKHEAAAVDRRGRRVYLTEDVVDGGLYRFTPARWPDLSQGLLEIARVRRGGQVEWIDVPDPSAAREETRRQVKGGTRFKRGEGIWLEQGTLFVATTADHRVHAYDTRRERIRVAYDGLASRSAPLLRVDQMTGSPAGEVFVCEDIATEEIDMGVIAPNRTVSRFLSATGPQHRGSELTGVTFDPSFTRMYVASQRAFPESDLEPGRGAIYEITGPFRRAVPGAGQRNRSSSRGRRRAAPPRPSSAVT
ncbi:MAG: alkaline phosphatase PhoX [Thermoleophilaceae bacterium]